MNNRWLFAVLATVALAACENQDNDASSLEAASEPESVKQTIESKVEGVVEETKAVAAELKQTAEESMDQAEEKAAEIAEQAEEQWKSAEQRYEEVSETVKSDLMRRSDTITQKVVEEKTKIKERFKVEKDE